MIPSMLLKRSRISWIESLASSSGCLREVTPIEIVLYPGRWALVLREIVMPSILMVGPSPESMGGIATVEKNMLEAAHRRGEEVTFLPTTIEGGKARKLATAMVAYARYLRKLKKL